MRIFHFARIYSSVTRYRTVRLGALYKIRFYHRKSAMTLINSGSGTALCSLGLCGVHTQRLTPCTPDADKNFTGLFRHSFAEMGPRDLKMV